MFGRFDGSSWTNFRARDAIVQSAGLLLRQAETADATDRSAEAARATDGFASALAGNPALTRVWSASAAHARLLARAQ